jgi:hypothetical protein
MPGMHPRPGCGDNACPGRVYWSTAPNGRVGESFKQSDEARDPAALIDETGEPDAE